MSEQQTQSSAAGVASELNDGLGAVLTYSVIRMRGVFGNTIGADGSGEFAELIYGTPEEAWIYAKDFLSTLEARGFKVKSATIVLNEECYGGFPIRCTKAPNAN